MSDPMDPANDLDVEVSALETSPASPAAHQRDSVPRAAELHSTVTPAPPLPGADVSVPPPRTPRQRLVIATSFLALVAVLLAAILLVSPDNRAAVLVLLQGPTATPARALDPGEDAFLWEHTVPWGTLLIDGHLGPDVRGSALYADGQVGAPFHLARGRHTLQYHAAPFPLLTCTVSVPGTFDDTCPLDTSSDISMFVPDAPATRLLDLNAGIEQLPRAQAAALTSATQAYLRTLSAADTPGAIAIGDHYRDSSWQITQASAPLLVTPQYVLTDPRTGDPPCLKLCGATSIFEAHTSAGLAVHALVDVEWRYATPDGGIALPAGPSSAYETRHHLLISLLTQWDNGSWGISAPMHGTPPADPLICGAGEVDRAALQIAPGQAATSEQMQWTFETPTAELGCLYAGKKTDNTTGKSSGPVLLTLYRAGALMAVNAETQRLFPTLPVATPHEQALAAAVAPTRLE